ncbi:MAG TPA: GspH/FimT family pseudopilin [Phycisphaerae bacterium]|nr:GspH/FimT family pseudopilin [Phycisphaerae bacterium]
MRVFAKPIWAPPRTSATDRSLCGGFSLIELVTVVVIIALLASMAVPRFANSLAHRRVEAAARRIAADLALAQRRAVAASASQKVSFDVAANSYLLVGVQHLDHPEAKYVVPLSDDPYGATIIKVDLGATDTQEIVFDGYGVPDSGGTILVEAGGNQKTVTVDPDTGRASIQ